MAALPSPGSGHLARAGLAPLGLAGLGALGLAGAASCADASAPDELLVFAAASLRDVAAELGEAFEERHDAHVAFNFAGSNVLAQQIAAAPVADVFLSADERWIDLLAERDATVAATRRPFLANRLVVVARVDAELDVHAAADLATASYRYLALADPDGVPAGRYARTWLASVPYADGTVWEAVAPRLAPTSDVRAALALTESDPRVVGIVYASDALRSARVRVLFEPGAAEQPAIVYGAALVGSDRNATAAGSALARSFLDFLFSRAAVSIYTANGFAPPAPEEPGGPGRPTRGPSRR